MNATATDTRLLFKPFEKCVKSFSKLLFKVLKRDIFKVLFLFSLVPNVHIEINGFGNVGKIGLTVNFLGPSLKAISYDRSANRFGCRNPKTMDAELVNSSIKDQDLLPDKLPLIGFKVV